MDFQKGLLTALQDYPIFTSLCQNTNTKLDKNEYMIAFQVNVWMDDDDDDDDDGEKWQFLDKFKKNHLILFVRITSYAT